MPDVLLLATLDTKADELRFVADRLREHGCVSIIVDVGVLGEPGLQADVTRDDVAAAAGTSISELVAGGDRGAAMTAMGRGAAAVAADLHAAGRFGAALALGGSGGASLAGAAFGGLPLGVPKLVVSTVVAGDTRPFIGDADFTLMYPVVDLAGINRISARMLANAAAAVAGMASAPPLPWLGDDRPLVGVTMFGITTPCAERVRSLLSGRGIEALVFSANGVGGRSMERLIREGRLAGVVDVTTTELADRLVGGILPATDGRLEGAGAQGLPQVVSPGALDVVNFGPFDTVPDRFRGRRLLRHNAAVTLMRTTPEECAQLGAELAAKLAAGHGPRTVVLPLRGMSELSLPGGPFHDPDADAALFAAVRDGLPADVELVELDTHINDPAVADALAERFAAACRTEDHEEIQR